MDRGGRRTTSSACAQCLLISTVRPWRPCSAPVWNRIWWCIVPERYHVYWLCDDCPLDQFGRVQRALARRFNGDTKVQDLPRVMRYPASYTEGGAFPNTRPRGRGF